MLATILLSACVRVRVTFQHTILRTRVKLRFFHLTKYRVFHDGTGT
jgi:hypothetical protein